MGVCEVVSRERDRFDALSEEGSLRERGVVSRQGERRRRFGGEREVSRQGVLLLVAGTIII